MVPQDDYSPIARGDTGSPFVPVFRHKSGKVRDLSDVTSITLKMENTDTKEVKDGLGTWVIDDAANGKTHYVYAANDVDEVGEFTLYVEAMTPAGPLHADPKTLLIEWVP